MKKIKTVERLVEMIHSLDTIKKNMVMFDKLDKAVVNLMSASSDPSKSFDTGLKLIDLTGRSLELDKRISKLERK